MEIGMMQRHLPVKMRVLTEVRFQNAVATDPATIFLWDKAPHVTDARDVRNLTVWLTKEQVRRQQKLKVNYRVRSQVAYLSHLSVKSKKNRALDH